MSKKTENTAKVERPVEAESEVEMLKRNVGDLWKVVKSILKDHATTHRIEEDTGIDIDGDGYLGKGLLVLLAGCLAANTAFATVELDRWTKAGETGTLGTAYISSDESGTATLYVDAISLGSNLSVTGTLSVTSTSTFTAKSTHNGGIGVDTITEATAGVGVTADSVQCKDGEVFHSGTDGTDWAAQAPLATLPINYYVYFDDFDVAGYVAAAVAVTNLDGSVIGQTAKFSETADRGEWLVTITDNNSDEGETITVADSADGGWLKFVNNDYAADTFNCQRNGEAVKVESGLEVWFASRFSIEDVDKCDFYIGLADTDTDIPGGLPNDHMLFFCDAGVLKFSYEQANTNTTVTLNATGIDDHAAFTNEISVAFHSDGAGELYLYSGIDGGALTAITNLGAGTDVVYPAVDMTPSIVIKAGDNGADDTFVDYIWLKKERKY